MGPVRDAARQAGITVAYLPFRSPHLMPLEDRWRGLKQTVAANWGYASLDELTARALAWLDGMSDAERHRRRGLQTSKFAWLPNHAPSCAIVTRDRVRRVLLHQGVVAQIHEIWNQP